jgi:hypothetical protein
MAHNMCVQPSCDVGIGVSGTHQFNVWFLMCGFVSQCVIVLLNRCFGVSGEKVLTTSLFMFQVGIVLSPSIKKSLEE